MPFKEFQRNHNWVLMISRDIRLTKSWTRDVGFSLFENRKCLFIFILVHLINFQGRNHQCIVRQNKQYIQTRLNMFTNSNYTFTRLTNCFIHFVVAIHSRKAGSNSKSSIEIDFKYGRYTSLFECVKKENKYMISDIKDARKKQMI